MRQGIMTSETTPELRTAQKIWICIDPTRNTIVTNKDLLFGDGTSVRSYTDDDFSEQLVAAAVEERIK